MSDFQQFIKIKPSCLDTKLLKRKKMGNLRDLKVPLNLIDFSSNDYLGLAKSLKSEKNVGGSTGSRLLTGNSSYAENLEAKIAQFHGYETGTLFGCGYLANIGLLSAVTDRESVILFDAHVHASTRDGIILSRAPAFPFRHNDLNHLENRLKNCLSKKDRFICVESIYSTDGSIAPLTDISFLSKKYSAYLIVDEAHAGGVLGPQGRGLVAEYNLESSVFAQIITFGKALGAYGAIVLGSKKLKANLINFANSYIYTTAPSFQMLSAICQSYDLFPQMNKEREHIQKLIAIFQKKITTLSKTHIQAIPVKGNDLAKKASQELAGQGFDVRPLLSPTVQKGHEVLRICLHAFNTEKDLSRLLCTKLW